MAKRGDISKQVYKFQEGITAVALELAGYPPPKVHWPVTARPEGLTVDVDVLIGPSPEAASVSISLKHMTSGKESEKGGWRMMREILDSKANSKNKIRIYSVFFDHGIKENWGAILAAFFDGYMVLPKHAAFGPVLIEKAYEYCRGPLRKLADTKARDLLRDAVSPKDKKHDPKLAKATIAFSKALAKMLKSRKAGLDSLWKRISNSCSRGLPKISPRLTSFKRGLAKLLIFESTDRKAIYEWFRKDIPIEYLPKYSVDLQLAEEGLTGDFEICDPDITRLFDILPADAEKTCEYIYDHSPVERMLEKYIVPLRDVSNVLAFHQYIVDHHGMLVTARGMRAALEACFLDPMALLSDYVIDGKEKSVWLFTAMMAVLKSVGGTKQSYGLASLAGDTGMPEIAAGGFLIPPFVYREKALPVGILSSVAQALSRRLKEIGRDECKKLAIEIRQSYAQRLMETQLVPYKAFDPIGVSLKRELEARSVSWTHHSDHPTCAKEYARTTSGGTTKALQTHSKPEALIMWQSPNKNARDKAKEFAARSACLVSRYDSGKKRFVSRGVRLFMIIDGIWDDEDITSLLRFGCEGVFYPDEIDKLVDALAGRPAAGKTQRRSAAK